MRVTLLCHAATDATQAARFPLDDDLSAKGRRSLTEAALVLPKTGRCLTSPARRAIATAEILGLVPQVDERLRDLDCGTWAGRSLAEVEAAEPDAVAVWLTDPEAAPHGGESIRALAVRIGGWLDGVDPGGGALFAVTHAAVIRAAIVVALGADTRGFWRIDVAPLSIAKLSGQPGRWTLTALAPS